MKVGEVFVVDKYVYIVVEVVVDMLLITVYEKEWIDKRNHNLKFLDKLHCDEKEMEVWEFIRKDVFKRV